MASSLFSPGKGTSSVGCCGCDTAGWGHCWTSEPREGCRVESKLIIKTWKLYLKCHIKTHQSVEKAESHFRDPNDSDLRNSPALESWLLLLLARCRSPTPGLDPGWTTSSGDSSGSTQGDGGWLMLGEEAEAEIDGLGLPAVAAAEFPSGLGLLQPLLPPPPTLLPCCCCCFSSSLFSFSAQAARLSSSILRSSSSRRRRARSTAAEISVEDCFLR